MRMLTDLRWRPRACSWPVVSGTPVPPAKGGPQSRHTGAGRPAQCGPEPATSPGRSQVLSRWAALYEDRCTCVYIRMKIGAHVYT